MNPPVVWFLSTGNLELISFLKLPKRLSSRLWNMWFVRRWQIIIFISWFVSISSVSSRRLVKQWSNTNTASFYTVATRIILIVLAPVAESQVNFNDCTLGSLSSWPKSLVCSKLGQESPVLFLDHSYVFCQRQRAFFTQSHRATEDSSLAAREALFPHNGQWLPFILKAID